MEAISINDLISPEGFYSLWGMPSRAEVVSFLVLKYGNPTQHLSIEEAEKLIEAHAKKEQPIGNGFRSTFTHAGISFDFMGTWLDMKVFPAEAVEDLERMKENKCEGYAYLKSVLGLPVMNQKNA